jgi:PTH1 family peptidyl-tRNA hydrolase
VFIFGLGNPGDEYRKTRHNTGFLAVECIADKMRTDINKLKFNSLYGTFKHKGREHYLIKPLTYMNLSGDSVKKWVSSKRIDSKDILVIYDDIDLPVGSFRIRKTGNAGTHKGMISITEKLGTNDFPRIRVGIKGDEDYYDLAKFVLTDFKEDEFKEIKEIIKIIPDVIIDMLNTGIEKTMTKYNKKTLLLSNKKGDIKPKGGDI